MRKQNLFKALMVLAVLVTIPGCETSIGKWGIFSTKNKKQGKTDNVSTTIPPAPSAAVTPTPIPPQIPEKNQESNIAIEINGEKITRDEFNKGYQDFLIEKGLMDGAPAKEKYQERLIQDLLFLYYAKENKIIENPKFKEEFDILFKQFVVNYVKKNVILGQVQISNSEIENYYRSNLAKYTEPEKVQVRQIQTNTEEEAQIAKSRLNEGEDFRKVASEISIHSSRNKGGDLPPFARGTYNPVFEEAAFKLKIGETSAIIKSETGYHIIEKTGEYPSQVVPLDSVKGDISRILLEQKESAAIQKFLEQIKKEVTIKIYSENQNSGNTK